MKHHKVVKAHDSERINKTEIVSLSKISNRKNR